MNEVRYSPLPIEDYFIPEVKPICSIQAISRLDLAPAVWNLYWMSNPNVDVLPTAGNNWHAIYKPQPGLQGALVTDVYEDEVLCRKLGMPPASFLDWWRREDHTIYDAYELGGAEWVHTVSRRAEEAVARMSNIIEVRDNVIAVKFGRAA